MLNREQILGADDFKREVVSVPEWGGEVLVRTMSGSERDRFESEYLKDKTKDFRAKLAAFTVCDEAGTLLFTLADVAALGAKSVAPLQRIFNVAMRLNALTKSDVDELAGNS